MDKLSQIKQKYGYVTPITNNIVQEKGRLKAQITKREPLIQSQNKKQNSVTTKEFDKNENYQCHPSKLQKNIPNQIRSSSIKTREGLKQVELVSNNKNLNQSFVKSYQKTYDLLKNYRNRIVTNSETQRSESRSKLIVNNPQKTAQSNQKSIKQQNERMVVSQRTSQKVYPKRCSPLQGVDLNSSVNVYNQIQNISRLQQRINYLIKQKSFR